MYFVFVLKLADIQPFSLFKISLHWLIAFSFAILNDDGRGENLKI